MYRLRVWDFLNDYDKKTWERFKSLSDWFWTFEANRVVSITYENFGHWDQKRILLNGGGLIRPRRVLGGRVIERGKSGSDRYMVHYLKILQVILLQWSVLPLTWRTFSAEILASPGHYPRFQGSTGTEGQFPRTEAGVLHTSGFRSKFLTDKVVLQILGQGY